MNSSIWNGLIPRKIAHGLVAAQNKTVVWFTTSGWRRELGSVAMLRLGTTYGGWWVPRELDLWPTPRVLVSAGLGFDVTFDQAMLERNFIVIGLDPLKECCEYATQELATYPQVKVLNLGVSTFSGKQTFYEPKISHHDSWSTINAQEVIDPISKEFEVISLGDLWSTKPLINSGGFKYLKMDIEGAELAILEKNLGEVVRFDFIAIEMDFLSLLPFLAVAKRINRVARARKILEQFEVEGFSLVHIENFNFFWCRTTI
jgi:FkbM family methyltransferase